MIHGQGMVQLWAPKPKKSWTTPAQTNCRTCESARSKGKDPAYHDCRQNHKGSSKSMEPEVDYSMVLLIMG